MADALTTITTFINSPPGQVVAGGVLAGLVWKFFERVEQLLTDQAKFGIAIWLIGSRTERAVVDGLNGFGTILDGFFGRGISWRGFRRFSYITAVSVTLGVIAKVKLGIVPLQGVPKSDILLVALVMILFFTAFKVIPDYLAYCGFRWGVGRILQKRSRLPTLRSGKTLDSIETTSGTAT